MCGIAGLITANSDAAHDRHAHFSSSAFQLLANRGPDSQAASTFGGKHFLATFLHTRLAIIGPNPSGAQPMESISGRTLIVFNGEIYNFKRLRALYLPELEFEEENFGSDTRVLVELWEKFGKDCLGMLHGMWSFAVYSQNDSAVTLVRDQFGIKPLYYRVSGSDTGFSSDPSLLLRRGDVLNPSTCAEFLLEDRYDRGSQTFIVGVSSLQPGHYVEFNLSSPNHVPKQIRWVPGIVETSKKSMSFDQAKVKLRTLFFEAVEQELLSDRPLAFALSGGIDSAAIVAVTRQIRPKMEITTFTYAPEGFKNNEAQWARLMSAKFGTIHHEVDPSLEDIEIHFPLFVNAQRQPVDHPRFLAQYMVFKAVSEQGFRVLVEGQGADEILGGYVGYPIDKAHALLKELKFNELRKFFSGAPDSAWSGFHTFLGLLLRLGGMPRNTYQRFAIDAALGTGRLNDYFDVRLLREALKSHIRAEPTFVTKSPYNQALYHSATFDLLPRILRHGDANAMAHSVENRVPFLHQPFAEFAIGLPHDWLYPGTWRTKWIFREAMRGIVPNEVLDRREKIGFDAPLTMIEDFTRKLLANESQLSVPSFGFVRSNDQDREFSTREVLLRLWIREFELVHNQ